MMQKLFRPAMLLAVLASLAMVTFSAQAGNSRPIVPADEFLAAFDDLREDLQDGIPRQLNRSEWRDFDRIHERFKSILSGVEDARTLPSQQQLALYNLQNELDGLIMGGIHDQKVCTEQRNIGSRIPRRNCRTVREIEQDRERARDWLGSFPFQLEGPSG
jgi:hypothetical protein